MADINGDGSIDISDPVYMLSALFLGGDGPVWGGTPYPVGTCTAVPSCATSASCQ